MVLYENVSAVGYRLSPHTTRLFLISISSNIAYQYAREGI